jgi:hypothetical protein
MEGNLLFVAIPKRFVLALGVAFGVYSIVYGLVAKTFSFRSRSFTFEEPSKFVPRWQDRALVVFGGVVVVIFSLLQLLGLHWHH